MKTFNTQRNIGKVKYVVNFHDGIKTHKDGSPFYGLKILHNKKELAAFVNQLKNDNYMEK